MPAHGFTDDLDHQLKRELSRLEKETVLSTRDKALILPGLISGNLGHTNEIEELRRIGFPPARIVAVDNNNAAWASVVHRYGTNIPAYHAELIDYLSETEDNFSYAHLDFLGQYQEDEQEAVELLRWHLGEVARVRITISYAHMGEDDVAVFERPMRDHVIFPFLEYCKDMDEFDLAWDPILQEVVDHDRAIQVAGFALFANCYLGLDMEDLEDQLRLGDFDLSKQLGTHELVRLHHFDYNDTSHSPMGTLWVDCLQIRQAFPTYQPTQDQIMRTTYNVCANLFRPSIEFRI